MRSHSNDLGVAQGLASWTIAHHLYIDHSYLCHVGSNNDIRVLWAVLASLFTSRVLSLSAWKGGVDSDLPSRGGGITLEGLFRGIWALSLRVISWAIGAIWWLLVRWSQDSHALCTYLHTTIMMIIVDLLLSLLLGINLASKLLADDALPKRNVHILLVRSINDCIRISTRYWKRSVRSATWVHIVGDLDWLLGWIGILYAA